MREMGFGLFALVAIGCSGDGKQPDVPPELSITPEVLDFGTVGVGAEAVQEITVANLGGGSLSVLSVNLTEGDADVWRVDRTGLPSDLGAGLSGVVTVTFQPEDDDEAYTGEVQIRTDDGDTPSVFVSMSGRGGLSTEDYDGDGVSVADGDCDDGNPYVFPAAEEICDGIDNNCDGVQLADEVDADYDGWLVCEGDCNDDDGNIYPGAPEICDYADSDCDGSNTDTADIDGDGFSVCDGDCDDNEPLALPEGVGVEVCDGVDNDCDGGLDDIDLDGDGHSVCSDAGDCDDNDPNAFPVVVDPNAGTGGDGTDADPYDSIGTAFANLDQVCRTVLLESGTYTDVDEAWSDGVVSVVGRSGDAADVVLEAATDARHFTVTNSSELTLRDLTLTGGNTSYAVLDGGSVSVANSILRLDNVVAQGNTSGADGGAIAVSSGTLILEGGCVFDGNTAGDDGGAISINASTMDDTAGTLYTGNVGTVGGAIFAVGGAVTITDAEFASNAADEGGAMAVSGAGTYTVERNWIKSNDAAVDGGGLALRDFASAASNFRNNRIQDNVADAGGGGIAVIGATAAASITNNTLTGNEAVNGEGGGILIDSPDASGAIVASNVMHSCDGASAFYVDTTVGLEPLASFNTVFGTNSGIHFAGVIGDGTGTPLDPTNQVRNPLLVNFSDDLDPNNDDLGLQAGSPEIDSGVPQAAFDDTDGSVNDRGYTGGPAAP